MSKASSSTTPLLSLNALAMAITIGGCGATLGQGVADRAAAQPLPVAEGCHEEPSDHVSIDGAELAGGALYLQLRHGGGCAEHEYRLCPSDRILTSDPAQWDLFVVHDGHDDECRALISRTFTVDEAELGRRIGGLGTIDGRRIRVMVAE